MSQNGYGSQNCKKTPPYSDSSDDDKNAVQEALGPLWGATTPDHNHTEHWCNATDNTQCVTQGKTHDDNAATAQGMRHVDVVWAQRRRYNGKRDGKSEHDGDMNKTVHTTTQHSIAA